MKNLKILLITVLAFMSCSEDRFSGSGDLISEIRNVSSFTRVKSEGVFRVNIIQSNTQSVEIIADDNIIERVKTSVVNNELQLSLERGNYRNIILEVNIKTPRINGVKNSGSGYIYANNVNEQGNFRIENSGSGDIRIQGNAKKLISENSGSGNILGFEFLVEDCDVEIEGSGELEITCFDKLNVEIDGSGNVYFKGNPIINTDINGSGQVINRN